MRNKIFSSGRVKVVDDETFITEHVISTEDKDRDDEVILFEDLEAATVNYRKNPIVLFYHNLDSATPRLPVGRNLELRREGRKIIGRTQFAVKEDESGFTRTLWNLHVNGYLNAVSIGFVPGEIEMLGEGNDRVRVVHVGELLEYSLVPIPANPEAVTVMAKALAKQRTCRGICENARIVGFATADAALKAIEAEIERNGGQALSPEAQAQAMRLRETITKLLEIDDVNEDLVRVCRDLTMELRARL